MFTQCFVFCACPHYWEFVRWPVPAEELFLFFCFQASASCALFIYPEPYSSFSSLKISLLQFSIHWRSIMQLQSNSHCRASTLLSHKHTALAINSALVVIMHIIAFLNVQVNISHCCAWTMLSRGILPLVKIYDTSLALLSWAMLWLLPLRISAATAPEHRSDLFSCNPVRCCSAALRLELRSHGY